MTRVRSIPDPTLANLICPISTEIYEEPVRTTAGSVYVEEEDDDDDDDDGEMER